LLQVVVSDEAGRGRRQRGAAPGCQGRQQGGGRVRRGPGAGERGQPFGRAARSAPRRRGTLAGEQRVVVVEEVGGRGTIVVGDEQLADGNVVGAHVVG